MVQGGPTTAIHTEVDGNDIDIWQGSQIWKDQVPLMKADVFDSGPVTMLVNDSTPSAEHVTDTIDTRPPTELISVFSITKLCLLFRACKGRI